MWVLIVGVVFGFITLAYFIVLSVLPIAGYDIPCASRFPVIVVLALCAAFASAFLGGYASLQGQVPLPFAQQNPISFAAAGGFAVMIIVLLVGYWLYVAGCEGAVRGVIRRVMMHDNGTDKIFVIEFDPPHVPTHVRTRIEASYDATFQSPVVLQDIDRPELGHVDVVLQADRWPIWFRLHAFNSQANSSVPALHSAPYRVDNP
jgi:hypothetical protein